MTSHGRDYVHEHSAGQHAEASYAMHPHTGPQTPTVSLDAEPRAGSHDDHADRGHSHAGHHAHGPAAYDKAFAIGVSLNLAFVLVEAGAGVLAGSLALVADAGHNLSDVLALALAWGATVLCRRVPTARRTYGWRRSSILAALLNAVALVLVVCIVAWEAIDRLLHPQPVDAGPMIAVAALGVLVNGAAALLFLGGRQHDANIRGAFLHLAADAAVSIGVVVAGLTMLATGWLWVDPAVSLAISCAILLSTWRLLREALDLALDAVPAGVDEGQVRGYLEGLPGVVEVHDLHIWALSTTQTALTAHLVMREIPKGDALLSHIASELFVHFDIEHPTLQIEAGEVDHPCALAPAHLV
jgi:cobalt-zinc-cadmium efflux system protein